MSVIFGPLQILLCFFAMLVISMILCTGEWILFENIFEDVFILQVSMFDLLEERVNSIGIAILITFSTLVIWPCNILMAFILLIVWLLKQIVKGFLYLFGKPDYDLYCCNNCTNFKWNLDKKRVCEPECKNAEIKYMGYSTDNNFFMDAVKYCQNFEEKTT